MKNVVFVLMILISKISFSIAAEVEKKEETCSLLAFHRPSGPHDLKLSGMLKGNVEFLSSINSKKIILMPSGVDIFNKKYSLDQIHDCQKNNKCDSNLSLLNKILVLRLSNWAIDITVDDFYTQSVLIENEKYSAKINYEQLRSSPTGGNCGIFGKKAKELFLKKYLNTPEVQKIISDLKMCISDKTKKCEYIENNYLGSGNKSFKFREIDSNPLLKAEGLKMAGSEDGYHHPYENFALVAKITNYDISFALVGEMLAFSKDKIEVEFQGVYGSKLVVYLKNKPSDKSNFKYKASIAFDGNFLTNKWELLSIDLFYFEIDNTGEGDNYK